VAFEYFGAEQLGKARDLLSLTVSGAVDVGYVAPSLVPEKMPLAEVAMLPGSIARRARGPRLLAAAHARRAGADRGEAEQRPLLFARCSRRTR